MAIITSPTRERKQGTKRHPALIGGAALVLAAVIGIGAWQANRDGSGSAAVTSQPGGSTTTHAAQVGPDDRGPVVYIVGSQEQADAVQMSLDQAAELTAQMGTPPVTAEVVVIIAPAEEARLRQGIAESDTIRGGQGLPGSTVVDLRSSVALGAAQRDDGPTQDIPHVTP